MIELDSALIILMAEALAVLSILALGVLWLIFRRKKKEHAAAKELINRLEEAEIGRIKKLGQVIQEHCLIDNDKLKEILKEISQCERTLYQQILQVFLRRDVAVLQDIDRYVNKLATPYCQLLQESNSLEGAGNEAELEQARERIRRLKQEGALLSEQLQKAMQTMEEISNEYTRVFSGTQSELELSNSSKKMMGIFQQAEKSIRASFKELQQFEE